MTKKIIWAENSTDLDIEFDSVEVAIKKLSGFLPDSIIYFNRRYEDDITFKVKTKRIETDEEYQLRLDKEFIDKSIDTNNKRKLLAQLKKELGED